MVVDDIVFDFIQQIIDFDNIELLSRKSGVPQSTIRSWIYYSVSFSLRNAQKVANAMGMEFLLFNKEK